MPDILDDTVGLVRLKAGISAAQFEQALRGLNSSLEGTLLEWAGSNWYALAPDIRKLVQDMPADMADGLGIADFKNVTAQGYFDILALRDYQRDASDHALSERSFEALDNVTVDAPIHSWDGVYQGKPVKIDWHFAAVRLPEVWAAIDQQQFESYRRILVGHIDTGYTEHPALGFGSLGGSWIRHAEGKNLWKRRVEMPSGSGEVDRWSSTPEFPGPRDNLTGAHGGHGTRTGGTLAGLFSPDGAAIAHPFFGAAPGASVIPYRIADSVLVDHVPKELAEAIDDAVTKGVAVISISMGAARKSSRVARAIENAYLNGVIVCAAAGQVVRSVIYPGRFNCVITVGGATTKNGTDFYPWKMAARGTEVDICGPADVIRRPTTITHKGKVKYLISGPGNGTSFATAICAGIAVLWLSKRAAELDTAYGSDRWARVEAFRQLLRDTAIKPNGWPDTYGAGVYDAAELMKARLPALTDLKKLKEDT